MIASLSPTMSIRSLRVVSQLLLFHVILLTFVHASENSTNSSTGLNDETVLQDLISGKRQILAIGRMVHSMDNKIVMLVAQLDDKGKLTEKDDIYVFSHIEQVTKGMVLKGGELLKSKWPELHHHWLKSNINLLHTMFMLSDSETDYVMVYAEDRVKKIYNFAYNVIDGNVSDLNREETSRFPHNGISSTEQLTCYCTDGQAAKLQLVRLKSDDHDGKLGRNAKIEYSGDLQICKGENNASDQVSVNQDCPAGPLDWPIWTGFVDDKFVHLIDKQGTVYKFDASALNDSSAKLETIKRSELFGSANDDNGTNSNRTNTEGNGGIGTGAIVIIIVVVLLLILVVVAVAAYCLCCSGKKSPKQGSRVHHLSSSAKGSARKKSSKIKGSRVGDSKIKGSKIKGSRIKGSKIKGSKVATSAKKSSKIASRVRSKRGGSSLVKGGKASKASTGRSSALAIAYKPASKKLSGRNLETIEASGRHLATKPASIRKLESKCKKTSSRRLASKRKSSRKATSRKATTVRR